MITTKIRSQKELLAELTELRNLAIGIVCGEPDAENRYPVLRKNLRDNLMVQNELPSWLRTCRGGRHLFEVLRIDAPTYAERRCRVRSDLEPAFRILENTRVVPVDKAVDQLPMTWESVQRDWRTAIDRKATDPAGAITLARTVLESACKCLLDEFSVTYTLTDSLPQLYALAAKQLSLAPALHKDDAIRRILGGCHSIVDGLAQLRNAHGDAHGKGVHYYRVQRTRCVSRRRFAQRARLALFTRARLPQHALTIALRPAES